MAACDLKDELCCSVCLNIYTDPVSLRCGHTYCQECIVRVLESQEEDPVYKCPNCRKSYMNKPVLIKNVALRNITDRYLATNNEQGRQWVFCSYCLQTPVPAIRHCQLCEASLCDDHVRVHNKSPKHRLCELSPGVGVPECSSHRQALERYCVQDAVCVCSICLEGEHQGHQLESLQEVSERKKANLRRLHTELSSKSQESTRMIQHLKLRIRAKRKEAKGVSKRVRTLLRVIKTQVGSLEKRIMADISKSNERASAPILSHVQRLEAQNKELSKRMFHIDELCTVSDPLTVLQQWEMAHNDLCHTGVNAQSTEQGGELERDPILETLYSKLADILSGIKNWFSLEAPARIILDLNTAANDIYVSRHLKFAFWTSRNRHRPHNPERFHSRQVISSIGISSGRHYWDVEVSSYGHWRIGICYLSIERSGDRSYIGNNDKSWCVCNVLGVQDSMMHNGEEIELPLKVCSDKIRVWLDYEAGQLSFFDIGDSVKHLYTFTATFVEPLHAAFYIEKGWSNENWIRINY